MLFGNIPTSKNAALGTVLRRRSVGRVPAGNIFDVLRKYYLKRTFPRSLAFVTGSKRMNWKGSSASSSATGTRVLRAM